jgi:hypothetical protein
MTKRNDSLLSPGFLAGLLVLITNDFWLKDHFHNAITGKLSDLTGLFIFPLFISAISRSTSKHLFFGVALFFVYWKSPFSDGLLNLLSFLSGLHFTRVVDYTDLLCLPVLIVSYRYALKEHYKLHISRSIVIFLSAFAFMATSPRREAYIAERNLLHEGYQVIVLQEVHMINSDRMSSVTYNDPLLELRHCDDDTLLVTVKSTVSEMHPPVFMLKDLRTGNAQLVKIYLYKDGNQAVEQDSNPDEQKWVDLLNTEISKRHLILQRKKEYQAKIDLLIKRTLSYYHDKDPDEKLFLIDSVLESVPADLISRHQLYELKADVLIRHYDPAYKKEILLLYSKQDHVDSIYKRSAYSVNRYGKRLDFYDFVREDSLKRIQDSNRKKPRP